MDITDAPGDIAPCATSTLANDNVRQDIAADPTVAVHSSTHAEVPGEVEAVPQTSGASEQEAAPVDGVSVPMELVDATSAAKDEPECAPLADQEADMNEEHIAPETDETDTDDPEALPVSRGLGEQVYAQGFGANDDSFVEAPSHNGNDARNKSSSRRKRVSRLYCMFSLFAISVPDFFFYRNILLVRHANMQPTTLRRCSCLPQPKRPANSPAQRRAVRYPWTKRTRLLERMRNVANG